MIVFLDGNVVPACELCNVIARQPAPQPGTLYRVPLSVDQAVEAGWVVRKRLRRGGAGTDEHLCPNCKTAPARRTRRAVPESLKVATT
jgi:hypothetical protein